MGEGPRARWGLAQVILTSLLFLPRFAKASLANYLDWRIFSTNTVSDPGNSPASGPTPISPGFRGLIPTYSVSGVDLQFWAHEHSYERLWPIYNYQVRLREG